MPSPPAKPRRCPWCGDDPLYVALSRPGVGIPGRRRPAPVREALPRRLPVGPRLDHDPAQARGVSRGVRRLRLRARRAHGRARRRSACSATPASFATAARSSRRSTTRSARASWRRARLARGVLLALRARRAARPKKLTRDVLATMATSPESIALAKDLKRRGWSFVGPTTVYAFMQAMGLVNDHLHDCDTRRPCATRGTASGSKGNPATRRYNPASARPPGEPFVQGCTHWESPA